MSLRICQCFKSPVLFFSQHSFVIQILKQLQSLNENIFENSVILNFDKKLQKILGILLLSQDVVHNDFIKGVLILIGRAGPKYSSIWFNTQLRRTLEPLMMQALLWRWHCSVHVYVRASLTVGGCFSELTTQNVKIFLIWLEVFFSQRKDFFASIFLLNKMLRLSLRKVNTILVL